MALFSPIVEFYPVSWTQGKDRPFLDLGRKDHQELRGILRNSKGIYSFYNSEYEIIYLGKTNRNLWDEMKGAYNRVITHYKRYYVNHPRGKFQPKSDGTVRAITEKSIYMYDAATFFSAYHVPDEDNIDDLEKLLIRMIPNDILNHRMEGNSSLVAHEGS